MARNNQVLPSPTATNRWQPFNWNDSPNFLNQTLRGRQMLDTYKKVRSEELEEEKRRKEEQRRLEEIRRLDKERREWNAAQYRKENELRWKKYREEHEETDAKRELRRREQEENDAMEERAFKEWAGDSFWKDSFFGRRFFDIKNQLGSLVTSSIDTNGQAIQGKISMNQLRLQAANAHDELINLQNNAAYIEEQRALFDEVYAMDPTYMEQNPNDPKVQDYVKRRKQFDDALANNMLKMQDPTLKGLDDAYKAFYLNDKKSILGLAGDYISDAIQDLTTFEWAMPQVRAKRRAAINNEYQRAIDAEQSRENDRKYASMPLDVALSLRLQDVSQRIKTQFDPTKTLQEIQLGNLSDRTNTELVASDQMRQKAANENEELRAEYIQNRTHLADSLEFWNVSEGFKRNTLSHANDALYNPYYWWYNLSPMIGSSISSPAQAAGTVIKGASTIAGLALAPVTEGGSMAALFGGEALATPLEMIGAWDENYAEAGDKRIQNIINMLQDTSFTGEGDKIKEEMFGNGTITRNDEVKLPAQEEKTTYDLVIDELKRRSKKAWKYKGWTDEQIDEYLNSGEGDKHAIADYVSGITSGEATNKEGDKMFGEFMHPAFLKALVMSTAGLLAQFEANNMRTMGELPAQKIMMFLPTKWLKGSLEGVGKYAGKFGSKIVNRVQKSATGKVTAATAETAEQTVNTGARQAARTKYSNGFRKPESSFTSSFKSGYTVGGEIGDMLGFGYAGHVIGGFAGGTAKGLAHLGKQALNPRLRALYDGIEEKALIKYQTVIDKLTPEKMWAKALVKYGLNATSRNIGIGFSEAAEEAAQYLNSTEDFASKYGWSGMSLTDMIANDLKLGGRVFNAYLSLFGMSLSELKDDEEFWSNLKGGFMLGALPMANPSGIIQVAGNTVHGYKEYKTQDAMLTSGIMNREYDKTNRASLAEFARQAVLGHEQHVIAAIDELEAADSRREQPFMKQEDYDQRRKEAQEVMSMAKDKKLRGMLEAKGIKYGTEKYATAVADIYSMTDALKENAKLLKEIDSQKQSLYDSKEYNQSLDDVIDKVMSESQADKKEFDDVIKKAGDEAAIREIDAIREELGLDPGSKKYSRIINSKEYKERIAAARDNAEQAAQEEARMAMRQAIDAKTKLVNKLKSLILLKARHNTVEEFYDFLTDKFGLKSKRPDAKTIHDSIDAQIKLAKQQLAEVTKGTIDQFDASLSDAKVLDYLDGVQDVVRSRIVTKNDGLYSLSEQELMDLEAASALLEADRAVTQSYYDLFTEGIVKNKDGKYEYNPKQYKALRDKSERLFGLLKSGRIDEFKAELEREEEYIPAEGNAADNKYSRRVDAIIEANKRNAALDWAINEVYSGDAVNKLEEVFAEEAKKQERKLSTEELNKVSQESNPFERQSTEPKTKWESTKEKREAAFALSSKKYNERKLRAKEAYLKAKERYKNWKKGNLSSTVVPMLDSIVKAANALMYAAKTGAYKFAQFVEDFKEIAEDIDVKDILPQLKNAYNKRYAYYVLKGAEFINNLSTPEEVSMYGMESQEGGTNPEPPKIPVHQLIQDRLIADEKNVIEPISTHFDTFVKEGDNVVIYTNNEAISHSISVDKDAIKNLVAELKAANKSDEEFRSILQSKTSSIPGFPVDEYVKYRNVAGVEEAAARNIRNVKGSYIENGIKVRDAVIRILLGTDSQLDESTFPTNYSEFKKDILKLKELLLGLNLTIIDTGKRIYGTTSDGKKVSSEADIIAADSSGKVYVIDVRSGYKSIKDRWNTPASSRLKFTIEEQVTRLLKLIEDIITNKFNIPVKSLYCLPIVYNAYSVGIFVEKSSDGKILIPIKINSSLKRTSSVEDQRKATEDLVNHINNTIAEYNALVAEASKYTSEYGTLDPIVLQEYDTLEEYILYGDMLHAKYDDLSSRIDDLKQSIQNNINIENIIWNENAESITQNIPNNDTEAYVRRLNLACEDLDATLQYIPQLKATTQAEKDNIRKLYQTIFDAQKALDDLLLDPNASIIDVRAEEELIARAMEILAENKENFGAMSVFMRKWWADNFVIGKGNNTEQGVISIAQQFNGYVNTIKSWIDTLQNHVLQDLDNHEALQEWYSSILNRYFDTLLNNALAFANNQDDTVIKTGIQNIVSRGRDLINDFNDKWGTLPDEDFPGPPADEVERINRMPVAWKEYYNRSTAHSPGFDAMANSVTYYKISSSPTFTSGYVTQKSPVEDPENKATRFSLVLSDDRTKKIAPIGEPILRIHWWDGTKWDFVELPFVTDISKYPNPSQEDIQRFENTNRANKKFIKKVKLMLDYTQKHPEYRIDFTVSLNKGSINYDKPGNFHSVTDFLFRGVQNAHDLYTVSLSKEDRLGIGVFIKDTATNDRFYDVRAGKDLKARIGGFDELYAKQHLATQNGAIIYFYDYGDGNTIGVPIPSQLIGSQSALMLVDLISRYVNGERLYNGYDIMSLLKLRLYMSNPERALSKHNNTSNMITINNNGNIVIGKDTINIFTSRDALVKRISDMDNSTPADILNDNMASSDDPVLSQARSSFAMNPGLLLIQLPNGFILKRDDFTHENNDGSRGSTWLGYLLRNNILMTRATSRSYRLVNIDNLVLVKKDDPIRINTNPSVQQRERARRRAIDKPISDPFAKAKGGLTMTVSDEDVDITRGTEEQESFKKAVMEYFKSVFGNNLDVVFDNTEKYYIKSAARNQRIVGLCTSLMVKLSLYAPYSAMYHEAFHKLMELVLPKNTREQFYSTYRQHTKNGKYLTERQVAEGLANLFVDYMNRRIAAKNAKWYNKIFKWFDCAAFAMSMLWRFGRSNTRSMYTLYHDMNAGKYSKQDIEISEENAERFRKEFNDELYYNINGTNFQHIADSGLMLEMTRALSYYILESYGISEINPDVDITIDLFTPNRLSQDVIDDLTEADLPENEVSSIGLAFREVFKLGKKLPIIAQHGKNKGKTVGYRYEYPNFAAFKKSISDYISEILGGYSGKIVEEDNESDASGENREVQELNIDRYDRASYEFSKLESVNKKTKLFFSTIPYCTFDEEGRVVRDYSRNIYMCPTYMPLDEVYNILVNPLHNVQTVLELDQELSKLAEHSPMARWVYSKYHELVEGIYSQDSEENVVVDYDKEAFAILILNAIRSQKHDFVIALSNKNKNGEGKLVRIVSSALNRDSRQLPDRWTLFLLSGQVGVFNRNRDENGNYIFKEGMGGKDEANVFSRTAAFFNDVRKALSQSSSEAIIDGVQYNKDSLENIALLKNDLIMKLHTIGIIFSKEALDHMLLTQYGDMGAEGMLNWLSQTGTSSINTFLDRLHSFVNKQGIPVKKNLELGYSDIGFVRDLAKWLGEYLRISTQQTTLALNGKRLYPVSQNSSISHIINMLNTEDLDNETIRTLTKFGFNLTGDDIPVGSIILKAIKLRKAQHILAHTYIGIKTDNRGDTGSEYTDETTIDDYIAKMTMLHSGYIIFPTLADKGTWMILSGVKVPGITFSKVKVDDTTETTVASGVPLVRWFNGEPYLVPSNEVLNQMLEYATTERLAIQLCMENLGYDDIPGYEKQGRTVLPEEAKILNYHTPNKDKKSGKVIEPNGTRFLSLTKIVVKEKKGNSFVLNEYNLNDPNKSSKDLLKLANEKFFDKSEDEKREIMALTLAIQNKKEVEFALSIGLIEREKKEGSWTDKSGNQHNAEIAASNISLMNLQTKHLNEEQIGAVASQIMMLTPSADYGTWAQIPNGREKTFKYSIARSLAIAALLGDATNRHIISSQEVIRCFSGHPAEFKVLYDVANSKIKDSTFDIQKRIGGMISTGDDNVLNLPGINSYYTCAECEDYEVKSGSDVAEKLSDMFQGSQIRESWAIQMEKEFNERGSEIGFNSIESIWDAAYNMSLEELDLKATPLAKSMILKAKSDGERFAKSFAGKINVADGAAYITDTMCENMLRMRGAYSDDVKKAFDILRSEDTKYSWASNRDAYATVMKAGLVTTKYTAYGFRDHTLNGDEVSDVSVAYYNKFALFPIFPCLATGKMGGIYKAMLNEGVDMMFMTSAVKVGSQGAISFDGNKLSGKFNKYVQSYAYLRRQLNTEPEEGDRITAGTQAMKIGLLNLRLNRSYKDSRSGEQVSGQQILDRYMSAINRLAALGSYKILNMFMEDDGSGVDAEKLSAYLKDQLSSRNANKSLIEAILVVTDPQTGKKRLVCPLAATADATWIESILISTINKHIIDIVTPGSSFVQRSVFAMEGKAGDGEGVLLSDTQMSPEINNGEKLQMINEDGSMDAVISMDYFDKIVFKGKMQQWSFEEKRQWLIDHDIIGKNATANTVGYRIPTQAQSSIHALRFVDVVQAVQSTIILPEEFTKITGSDFDIDHLYLMSYNYNVGVSEDGVQYATTTYNPVEDEGKYEEQYYLNTIMDCLMTLLKDTGNSLNQLYKPIDNDTELITSISDQIPDEDSGKSEPFNFGTLREQVVRKNDYITGKNGIGPFALNVTNLILTQLFGVRFRPTLFTLGTGIERFDHLTDFDGNAISSWLSAFINAHVDIVKDPYIAKLNVNQFTYNMINLLIRSGFGDAAVWFVAQPVIKDMAFASERAKSQYARDPEKGKSTFAATEYAIREALLKYLTEGELDPSVINKYTFSNDKRDISVKINTVNWIKDHVNVLAEIVKNPDADTVTVDGVQYNVKNVLKTVFYAWKSLEKYAMAMSNLVQHTKIDTRKHGKSLIAINRYLEGYKELFFGDSTSSIWDLKSLQRMATGSWINLKTVLAINAPSTILGTLTFAANKNFINAVIRLGNILSPDKQIDLDSLNLISRSLLTAIKSQYIVRYAREKLGMSDKQIAGLFIGPRSINKRLTMLKNAIETNPKYSRLKNNHLINQIYSEIEENPAVVRGHVEERPAFITVLDNVDDSRVNSNLLIDGWEDMLNDEDKFVRQFARDLIVYAFMTSGEFKGWNKLFKYVPASWVRGEIDTDFLSFSDFVERALTSGTSDYEQFFEDIICNNFMDYRLSRRMVQENEDGTLNFIDFTSIVKIGKPVDVNQINSLDSYITVRDSSYKGRGVAAYNLYKLTGFAMSGEDVCPIYVRIKKKGYHSSKNSFDIYEYGWTFGYAENENEQFVEFDVRAALDRVLDYINKHTLFVDDLEASARAITDVYLGRNEQVVSDTKAVNNTTIKDLENNNVPNHYEGLITPDANTVFVFGSNPEGRHGAGAAKTAREKFGAIYGQGEGLQGNAYALPTKDLRIKENNSLRSISPEQITENIRRMYEVAKHNPDKQFKVAYTNGLNEATLNGYTGAEMIKMFKDAGPIPSNVVFSKNWTDHWNEVASESESLPNWKFEEYSGYSGVLEALPQKVRMNGRMINRPKYDFGRVYLTDNERLYVTEQIKLVDIDGNNVNVDANKLDTMINSINKLVENLGYIDKNSITVKYRDWKTLLLSVDGLEHFIEKAIEEDLNDWSGFSIDDLMDGYDKSTKTIKIDKNFYKIVEIMRDNFDIIKLLSGLLNDDNYYAVAHLLLNFENVYDAFDALNTDAGNFYYSNSYPGGLTLLYNYSDSRQQELFSEDPAFMTEEERKEAEEYKKLCNGE